MADIEWLRLVIIAIALGAVGFLGWLYMRKRQPIIIAGITWILMVVLFSIFKLVVDGDLRYYNASIVLNALIFIYGTTLLVIIGWAFRDLK